MGVLHISPDSSRKEILETIDKLGDDKLKDAVVKMTDEQLGRLVTSDSYTIYGINVDFKEKTVTKVKKIATITLLKVYKQQTAAINQPYERVNIVKII